MTKNKTDQIADTVYKQGRKIISEIFRGLNCFCTDPAGSCLQPNILANFDVFVRSRLPKIIPIMNIGKIIDAIQCISYRFG